MRLSKHLRTTIAQKFHAYCQHSTLHGIYYFHSDHHWLVYTIWGTVVLAGVSLCVFLSQMIWQKFKVDPTFTLVESAQYPTENLPFPSVTVCDTELIYGPNTENITHILRHRGYDMNQIYEFYKSFTAIRHKDYVADPEVIQMHYVLQDLKYTLHGLMDVLKKPCDVLITKCVWRSKPHDCSKMFRQVYTFAGYCCRFDIPYFKRHAAEDINFVSGTETTEALDITVNGQKVSASGTLSDGYVSLYVVNGQHNVTLVDNAIILTPAGFFDVNVQVWAIDSSPEVEALPVKDRKCILENEGIGNANFYHGCMTMMILKKVASYCRCLPFEYSSKELQVAEYAPCNWDRLTCIYHNIELVQSDMRGLISENDCLQKCDFVQYNTETVYMRHQRFLRVMNESFSRVAVHISSHTCLKYRREVLYTWDQMLANLGGIFGLCLGGSIISLIELLWFLVDLAYTVLTSFVGRPTPRKRDKKPVFTLTQKDLVSRDRKEVRGSHFQFVH